MKKKLIVLFFLLFLICGCGKKNTVIKDVYYDAIFEDNDTILSHASFKSGNLLEIPEEPTKDEYIFVGWTDNGEIFDFSKPTYRNLVLEAKWYENTGDDVAIVKFDSIGGTTIENQIIKKGEILTKPSNPEKDGYIFISWGINGTDFDFLSAINENLTLTANWKKINYDNLDNYEIDITAPRLTSSENNGEIELSIVKAGKYDIKNDKKNIVNLNIDGWILYEKIDEKYIVVGENVSFDDLKVNLKLGNKKVYVARVFKSNSNIRVYSDYSNELTVFNKVLTPKLVTPEQKDDYYAFDISYNGSYLYDAHTRDVLNGWEIYEKVDGSYKLYKSGTSFTNMGSITLGIGESRTFRCRVYVLDNKYQKVYSDYSKDLVLTSKSPILTPKLVPLEQGEDYYTFDISYGGSYSSDNKARNSLSGWEIYEKVDGSYKLYKSGSLFINMGNIKLGIGEKRTFRCRIYVLNSKYQKVYSNYSKDLVLTSKSSILTPELVTPEHGLDYYKFDISYAGNYSSDNRARNNLSGWEIYEKVDGNYQLYKKGTLFINMGTITLDIGETRTFRCRIYALNSKNQKVYSNYSKDLVLTNKISVLTPELVTPEQEPNLYKFDISYAGSYSSDDHSRDILSGWEIYEEKNGTYSLFKLGTRFTNIGSITLNIGETRKFKCRVYALNSKKQKIYSDYSKELTLSYPLSTPVLVTPEQGLGYYVFDISYDGSYSSDDHTRDILSGWEIYEKVDGSYKLYKSGTNFTNMGSITLNIGETKTFKCRVYVLNSSNEKIFSSYSSELILSYE